MEKNKTIERGLALVSAAEFVPGCLRGATHET